MSDAEKQMGVLQCDGGGQNLNVYQSQKETIPIAYFDRTHLSRKIFKRTNQKTSIFCQAT